MYLEANLSCTFAYAGFAYASALASATGGIVGFEDRRVTGGLLALAGASHLLVTGGLVRTGRHALPVEVLLWAAAWRLNWRDLRAIPTAERTG